MSDHDQRHAGFRSDINGLRAWAVLAVILYHFGVPGFGGGFVGVDVFFVISGFLMTGIVVKGLERGSFSLLGFYMARARRIVPALLALCAALLALAWWVLLPPDYKTLGTHVAYSLVFLSNIEFWQEAGYFDQASHEKWLLHTWSLAVEWQFYLLLPLVLSLVWRFRPGRLWQTAALLLGLLASLAACIVVTRTQPSAAFFLLHTRAWEMLGGGLVFLWAGPRRFSPGQRQCLQGLGLGLILLSAVVLDKQSAWPGGLALWPVSAAMLVLAAEHASPWLGHRALQWLGSRSYSLYLWHWPVYVALAYIERQDQALAVVAAMLLTLAIGHMSYVWVENPARRRLERLRPSFGGAALAGAAGLLLLPAIAIWSLGGVGGRFAPGVEVAAAEAGNFNPRRQDCYSMSGHPFPSCVYGGERRRVIGIGDSHLSTTISALAQARRREGDGVVEWSYRGCQFAPGMKSALPGEDSDFSCAEFTRQVLDELAKVPADVPVVLIGRYAASAFGWTGGDEGQPQVYFSEPYRHATRQFLDEFGQHITESACAVARQRRVYMVRPYPEMGLNVPKTLSRRMALGTMDDLSISIEQYRRRNAWVWAAQDAARERCGVRILDPLPYLCRDGRCYGSMKGRPLYFDDNHLSEYGNKLLVPMFAEVFGSD